MKNRKEEYSRSSSVPPAHLYNLLKAAYGSRNAESIFRSYGLNRPGTTMHSIQKSRMTCA